MRKFYLLALAALVTFSSFAEVKKIMVIGTRDGYQDTNHVYPLAELLSRHPNLECDVFPLDSVLNCPLEGDMFNPKYITFSDYDGIVMTEAPGSGDAGDIVEGYFRDSIGATMPMLCLKLYGIRYSRAGWHWLNQADGGMQYWGDLCADSSKAAEQTTVKVTDHEIFEGAVSGLTDGTTFNFADSARGGAHIQTADFSGTDPDSVSGITTLATSEYIASYNDTAAAAVTEQIMWTKDESVNGFDNKVWPKAVIMGTHAWYLNWTDEYKGVLVNSMLWALGETCDAFATEGVVATPKDAVANNVSVYPNPATDMLNVKFDGAASVTLYDVTGKVVFTENYTDNAAINVANLSTGVYVCSVVIDNVASTQRVIIK